VQKGKIVAVSDVHLDVWRRQDPETYQEKRKAFIRFLGWVRDASECEHFAVVGDLIDIPRPDRRPILPLFEDIAVALMSLVRSGVSFHYIAGNHDAGVVGIYVNMVKPGLQITYPGAAIRSGDMEVWLEHGHLMDAWLWEYVHLRTQGLERIPPAQAMAHFSRCPPEGAVSTSPTTALYQSLYDALQWGPTEHVFTPAEKRAGIRLMSRHLEDTYADVARPGEAPRHQAEVLAALVEHGVSVADLEGEADLPEPVVELFMKIGGLHYSPLPWRRAAQCKMREVRAQRGPQVRGLIMGHIHDADLHTWEEGGARLTYGNCGTWLGQHGSYVAVEDGELRSCSRKWSDPLP